MRKVTILLVRAIDAHHPYRPGADFSDALHLAVYNSAILHTFDRDFCEAAREAGIAPEVKILAVVAA
jgi:hypothetical protein